MLTIAGQNSLALTAIGCFCVVYYNPLPIIKWVFGVYGVLVLVAARFLISSRKIDSFLKFQRLKKSAG